MRVFEKKVISNPAGIPYLVRWSLALPGGRSIKLHHILRSDYERDLHDHPWSFVSIIIAGGYWEHTPTRVVANAINDPRHTDGSPVTKRTWHAPRSVLHRPCPWPHRLELPDGKTAWTLIYAGPKVREWGFRTVCGWIPWFNYNPATRSDC